ALRGERSDCEAIRVRGEALSLNMDDGAELHGKAIRQAVIVAAPCLAPHPEPPLRYGPDLSPQKSGERLETHKKPLC
ncbi:hypothetical protein, partial [Bradyrhizobium sp.]